MLLHLINKDLRNQIYSRRFVAVFVVAGVFIATALSNGYAYHTETQAQYELAKRVSETRIRQIVENSVSWGEIFEVGYPVQRPPAPLRLLAYGLDPVWGRTGQTSYVFESRVSRSVLSENPLVESFPFLDLSATISLVMGLISLVICYDAVSGEKHQGTLRLLSSFPVSRRTFLLGKVVSSWVPVCLCFVLPTIVGLAWLSALGSLSLTAPIIIRIFLLVVTFGLYLGSMVSAGIFFSTIGKSLVVPAVLVLLYWVLSAILLPLVSPAVAAWSAEIPSITRRDAQKRLITADLSDNRQERMRAWSNSRGQESGETAEWYLENQRVSRENTQKEAVAHARIDNEFYNAQDRWLVLSTQIARLSPAFALRNASVRLCHSGITSYRDFEASWRSYGRQLADWITDTFTRDSTRMREPKKYGEYRWDMRSFPRFRYEVDWSTDDIKDALVDMTVIALWGILFLAAAFTRMVRYDLR